MEWLNNEDNGLVKRNEANGLNLQLKFVPAEILAYGQAGTGDKVLTDSLVKSFSSQLNFVLTVTPAVVEQAVPDVDLLKQNVSGYEEYKQKLVELSFNLGEYFELSNGEESAAVISPSATNLENNYGLKPEVNVIVSFPKSKGYTDGEYIDIVFHDDFFLTGINHFRFKRSSFQNLPLLK